MWNVTVRTGVLIAMASGISLTVLSSFCFRTVELYMVFFGFIFVDHVKLIHCHQDEIFHIPQSQQYCLNNFDHWDTKITTFPGIYYTSYMFIHLYAKLFGVNVVEACSVTTLRKVNLMGSLSLPYIYSKCRSKVIIGVCVSKHHYVHHLSIVSVFR